MTKPIQLKLWPDDEGHVNVQCVHCGWRFDVLPQVAGRDDELEQSILADPRVAPLKNHSRRFAFFEAVLPILLYTPEPLGVQAVADATEYGKSSVCRYFKTLSKLGIVTAETKREGGTYHQYRLALLNGSP